MKIVLKHEDRWLHFCNPVKILCAERVDEVLPVLQEAEESGLFVAGFVSYEAAPAFDSALKTRSAEGFPLLYLGLFHAPDSTECLEAGSTASFQMEPLAPSVSKADFADAISAIKERIAEGATYQVNYTYCLSGRFSGDTWAFFLQLVKNQKTDYAAYVDTEGFSICSASPELFYSLKDGRIESRPMKGTARRGRTFAEDCNQAEALRSSEKDRAENIMIVDMIRNDIGRIAEPGSVDAASTYDIEKYTTVWQMTSTVRGNLKQRCRAATGNDLNGDFAPVPLSAIFKALFPCASITGAPKAKTMEIIRDLETMPRKVYTGAIGFMTPTGESSFNVAIRSALVDKKNGLLEYGVGGGVVWDSDPEAEYEETLTKARVLTEHRPEFQLLETMLWEPDSGIFLLSGHMHRIERTATYFDIPLDVSAIQSELDRLMARLDKSPHRLRLLVSRHGSFEVKYFPIEVGGAQASVPTGGRRPPLHSVRVALAKEPVDSQDVFLFHKTTHRAVYEQAKADFPECDDVILWNERNEATESTIANLVIRKDGKLITPPVESGLLAGTYREYLLNTGEIEEGIIGVEEVRSADEVFLVNSVRKWHKAIWAEEEVHT